MSNYNDEFDVLQEFLDEPRGGGLYLSPSKEGEYHIRLLTDPNLTFRGKPQRFFAVEYSYWLGSGKGATKLLNPKTFGDDDPLDAIQKEADAETKAIIGNYKLFRKSENYLFPCVHLKEDGTPIGFRIFQCSYACASKIGALINNRDFKDIGPDSIADIDEGHNIRIVRKGLQLDTEYSVTAYRKPSAISDEYFDDVDNNSIMDALEKQMGAEDYDSITDKLWEYLEADIAEPEPEPEPRASRRSSRDTKKTVSRRAGRRSAPEPEEPEDEEEEEEEEEIIPEKSTRKSKSRSARKSEPEPDDDDDEPEDEPDEEEEDEQEEPPKKPRGRGRPARNARKAPERKSAPKEEETPAEPVKRGRGRPAAKAKAAAPTTEKKRGRGRPAKAATEKAAEKPDAKRGRGRPAATGKATSAKRKGPVRKL